MIQDARNVMDSVGLLDDAEEEIVILGTVEFGTEPADAQNECAPHDDKMAEVVTGKKEVRRPIGLE